MRWHLAKRTAWIILGICSLILAYGVREYQREGWSALWLDPHASSRDLPMPAIYLIALLVTIAMILALLRAPRVPRAHVNNDEEPRQETYEPW
jgi:hypothetical protein